MALTNLEKLSQVRDCTVKVTRRIAIDNYLNCNDVLLDLEWIVENLDHIITSCLEKDEIKRAVDG